MRPAIAVFGGSQMRAGEAAYEQARELGRLLACSGYDIINGGYGGAMEATGLGAKEAGGRVTGVTVSYYGRAREYVDQEEPARDFWERTRRMLESAAGFVALAGGTGTLAEAACAWEAIHKRLVRRKPLVFLGEVWRPVVAMICADADSRAWCGGAVRLVATAGEAVRAMDEFFGRTGTG